MQSGPQLLIRWRIFSKVRRQLFTITKDLGGFLAQFGFHLN